MATVRDNFTTLIGYRTLDATSCQDVDNHDPPQIPFIYLSANCHTFLEIYSGVVSRCFLHGLTYGVFLLLDWLLPKARESNPLYYWTYNKGQREETCLCFSQGHSCQSERQDFELISPITLCALITVTLHQIYALSKL